MNDTNEEDDFVDLAIDEHSTYMDIRKKLT